jgi:hypothetical protein
MTKELSNFGDHAEISMQSNVAGSETVGIEGVYHVVCRDAEGNVKWEDQFPNLVNAVGKQLMLDTLLSGTSYTTVGPFLGLISGASPHLQRLTQWLHTPVGLSLSTTQLVALRFAVRLCLHQLLLQVQPQLT